MVEADIHLRLNPTSILNIYKVFEVLVCCLAGIWVHPYFIPPAKLAPFWNSGSLVEWKLCHCMMVEAHIHLRLLLTSILDMYKVFEVLVCRLTGIWVHLHHSTSQVGHILCFFCHLGGEMIQLHHS
jgi:hypothetical protein